MKKMVTILVLLLFTVPLSACDKDIQYDTSNRSNSTKRIDKSLKIAQQDTNALFDNNSHTKLLEGASSPDTIKLVEQEVKELKDSKEKNKLLADIEKAKKLRIPLAKSEKKFAAVQPSEKTDEQKRREAEAEEASSSKVASKKASKASISLKKSQSDYKLETIEKIQRIHKHIDGVNGIMFEALNLARRSGSSKKLLNKSLTKINLAINKCEKDRITSSKLVNDKTFTTNVNRYLELSVYELKSTKQLLENSLYKTDITTNSVTDEKNHDERLQLYETISK